MLYISSKDDSGNSDEVESKTTKNVPKEGSAKTEEGLHKEVLMGKEDSVVKEKAANKEKNSVSSLSRENSMEESLLCGICQVSILYGQTKI